MISFFIYSMSFILGFVCATVIMLMAFKPVSLDIPAPLPREIQSQIDPLYCHAMIVVSGKAKVSYYGDEFEGKPTAFGKPFHQNSRCIAHKTLPENTPIFFRYKDKTSFGYIGDRGPFIDSRMFDVSRKIAEELGMIEEGVITAECHITLSASP